MDALLPILPPDAAGAAADPAGWLALLALGAGAALAASALLGRLAPRLGWLDRPSGAARERKRRVGAVPPVGGAALALSLTLVLCAAPFAGAAGATLRGFLSGASGPAALAALGLALLAGLADDLRPGGLPPLAKLAAQAGSGLALATPAALERLAAGAPLAAAGQALAGVGAAWVATNLWNTFDNADGAAAGLGAVGLLAAGSPLAGALLGFLPTNLLLRRAGGRAPWAILGDAGSHLVGVLLLLHPAAWPFFLLPALDLARVALERARAGAPPWRGDRRHLAHRLQERGLAPGAVAALLWALGAAPLALPGPGGLALGALGYLACVQASAPRRAARAARACPGRAGTR